MGEAWPSHNFCNSQVESHQHPMIISRKSHQHPNQIPWNSHLGMDQYLLIPFLGGWTSINPSYFDVNYRGTRFWHTAKWEFHGIHGMLMGFSWDDHRMLMGFSWELIGINRYWSIQFLFPIFKRILTAWAPPGWHPALLGARPPAPRRAAASDPRAPGSRRACPLRRSQPW